MSHWSTCAVLTLKSDNSVKEEPYLDFSSLNRVVKAAPSKTRPTPTIRPGQGPVSRQPLRTLPMASRTPAHGRSNNPPNPRLTKPTVSRPSQSRSTGLSRTPQAIPRGTTSQSKSVSPRDQNDGAATFTMAPELRGIEQDINVDALGLGLQAIDCNE